MLAAAAATGRVPGDKVSVGYDERALTIDGERQLIISGSIHYPRSTPEMWPKLIAEAKGKQYVGEPKISAVCWLDTLFFVANSHCLMCV